MVKTQVVSAVREKAVCAIWFVHLVALGSKPKESLFPRFPPPYDSGDDDSNLTYIA